MEATRRGIVWGEWRGAARKATWGITRKDARGAVREAAVGPLDSAGRGAAKATGRAARDTTKKDAGTAREAAIGSFDIAGRGTAEATGRATARRARWAASDCHHHAGFFDLAVQEFIDVERRIGFFDYRPPTSKNTKKWLRNSKNLDVGIITIGTMVSWAF
jgi:hypothetical protein